jgi:hypothetical protein
MIVNDAVKNSLKPTNSGFMKLSFWIVVSILITQYDSFLKLFKLNKDWLEIENLSYFSLFMIISILFLKGSKFIVAITSFLFYIIKNKIMPNINNKEYRRNKDENIEPSYVLSSSIRTNNLTAYKFYKEWENNQETKQKTLEHTSYLLIIIAFNLSIKGSIYSFILLMFENGAPSNFDTGLIISLLLIIAYIFNYQSIYDQNPMYISHINNTFFKTKEPLRK